jgi:hypothetical protein
MLKLRLCFPFGLFSVTMVVVLLMGGLIFFQRVEGNVTDHV